jgi:hypothetical protein
MESTRTKRSILGFPEWRCLERRKKKKKEEKKKKFVVGYLENHRAAEMFDQDLIARIALFELLHNVSIHQIVTDQFRCA